ncbi:MAG: hypothetical protein HOM38_09225 [Euryarchaeota archaeon]|jgi:hypothetical protein|nr:hypothetical protein [Euryarchaeota archaeon]
MSITFEQKNSNILSRFESEKSGTKVKKFSFILDGKPVTMINMQNSSLVGAIKSLKSRWGERVSNVTEG